MRQGALWLRRVTVSSRNPNEFVRHGTVVHDDLRYDHIAVRLDLGDWVSVPRCYGHYSPEGLRWHALF